MNSRKRIAVLVGQAEESYQEQFISGFLTQAFDYDCDVCVFAMYQRYQESEAREVGESSIYSLIPYEQFDGILLMLDTIQTPGIAKKIEEDVKKHFLGPVLCVDTESEYFPSVELEYYEPIKELVSHLIEKHQYTDIAFLTGRKGHKHAEQRLQAYKDCMKEHDLMVREDRIFYGDFWYPGGVEMAERLLRQGGMLPEAIACANDYMAIGVANALTKAGLRIPEDIAVIGYESVKEGKDSPSPITSMPIPTRQYGEHAGKCMRALFEGKELPTFENKADMFIGSSCGCHSDSVVPRVVLRDRWETDQSERDFYSLNNHMNEDMLCQTNLYDLMKIIDIYVYHIRDFDTFHLCLNEDWDDFEKKAMEGRQDEIYSDRMLHILKCPTPRKENDIISFDSYFKTEDLLPELHEDRSEPSVYFFTPLHFEEKSFGYAVIGYRNKPRSYSATYRMWLRNVMQELECFRRIEALQKSHQMLENSMIKDVLTGLHNYNGFSKQIDQLVRKILQTKSYVGVMAIDIKELTKINDQFGRAEGDRTVITVARILKDIFRNGYNICLGNGEMLTILLSRGDVEAELQRGFARLMEQIEDYNKDSGKGYSLDVYHGIEVGMPPNADELERLVNTAVSRKNGNKVSEKQLLQDADLTEEEKKDIKLVDKILDENLFKYVFQPIVNAKNGEIYGYEALMRADVEQFISPLDILKYAEYSKRLYDVEKSTFFNVLNIVNSRKDIFNGDKKIFINSTPGKFLFGEDADKLEALVKELSDTVVVEMTEQKELTDEQLTTLQDYYDKNGFKMALDDYGTGYSNVTNLLRYMPGIVKIDRMLLSNIQDSPQKQHFVKDIISFSHDNDIVVLAEGIETTEELETVIHLGIDLIQGYYTAKPTPDFITSIPKDIKNEIIEYSKESKFSKGRRVYKVQKDIRISLARLVAEKYSIIEIDGEEAKNSNLVIAGISSLETEIHIRIKNGFQGKITLQNVIMQGAYHGAILDIGSDCDVELELVGENRFYNGGVRVPAGSRLVVSGNGHLRINIDAAHYFGIGNDVESRHGELVFNQDGIIEIKGSGMRGIAIGSGQGGTIHIQKGKYLIRLSGQIGVGIGSYTGDIMPIITRCDLRTDIATELAVGVGSVSGSVQARLERLSWTGDISAENAIGLGTLNGKKCRLEIMQANIGTIIRATMLVGIGSGEGQTYLAVQKGALIISGDGSKSIGIGNFNKSAKLLINGSRVEVNVATELESNLGIKQENLIFESGTCQYIENGEVKNISAEY